MERRSFLKTTATLGVTIPFVPEIFTRLANMSLPSLYGFPFNTDPDTTILGAINMVDLGPMGNGNYYRLRFSYFDGETMYARNSDTAFIDVVGKSDINEIRAMDGDLAVRKLVEDITGVMPKRIK